MNHIALERIAKEKEEKTGRLNLSNCGLTEWPEALYDLTWLEQLVVGNHWKWDEEKGAFEHTYYHDTININSLGVIPEKLGKLTNLQLLYANELGIERIENLDSLTALTQLHLGGNEIKKIENLDKLGSLTELDLRGNEISKIENLEKLASLTVLRLNSNEIQRIENLDSLLNLTELHLYHNAIQRIENLDALTALTQLHLGGNEIQKIENLEKLESLTELYLDDNQIQHIESLDMLTALAQLHLGSNEISKIENLDKLASLTQLDLDENKIQRIENLYKLSNLKELYLDGNQIQRIENLDRLSNLTELYLFNNAIPRIENLDSLTALTKLYLSINKIQKIENLETLTALTELGLSYNQIERIENLDNLSALTKLDLGDNQIHWVENLEQLTELKELQLSNNPTKNFPKALHEEEPWESCLENWLLWKKEIDNEKTIENYTVKMMVTGNGNVGKSSVIDALKNGCCTNAKVSTHGIIINSDLQHKKGKLFTWDFGGQELYHGTHRLFMNSDALQLIVFDNQTESTSMVADRINTYETTRNHPLPYWIENVEDNNSNNPIILVQNKFEDEIVHQEANTIAGERNFRFDKVSAIKGINIDDLEYSINKMVQQLSDYGMMIPEKWDRVVNYYLAEQQKQKTNKPIITLQEFEQIAEQYGIQQSVYKLLLTYLSNSGYVYYDSQYMPNHVVVHQKWVLDKIYAVLDRESDFYKYMRNENKGFCSLRTLWREWGSNDDTETKLLFTQFMRSCAICFPLRDHYSRYNDYYEHATFVFPEFLPVNKPLRVLQKQQDRQAAHPVAYYRYTHSYIGYKVMQQLIVAFGDKTDKSHYWRTGIMVVNEQNGSYFLIEYLEEEQSLLLTVEQETTAATQKYVWEKMFEALGRKKEGWEHAAANGKYEPCDMEQLIKKQEDVKVDLPLKESAAPLKIAISYAKEDNSTTEYGFNPLQELVDNLRIFEDGNTLRVFYDRDINESDWNSQIREEFKMADLIIILNSVHYNKKEKNYIWDVEIPIIEEHFRTKEKSEGFSVLRMNVSECNFREAVLGKFYDFKSTHVPREKQKRDKYFKDFVQTQIIEKIINQKKSYE